ncbi:hypothetical protein DFH09DRAFT_1323169 [Mycena vulgaris]|nr:hypothetical protein DFH09DRAFT_1323169 [Mycena vulgaris]
MLVSVLRGLAAIALAASVVAQSQIPLSSKQGAHHSTGEGIGLEALRLVQFSLDDVEPIWLTEREKLEAKANGMHFMDITDTPSLGSSKKEKFSYPSPNSTVVPGVLSALSKAETRANLEHFTSYPTRYYDSDTGRAASEWLYAKILSYTAELASEAQKKLITVEAVKHAWKQNSIVIRMAPPNASECYSTAILGAHIDSVNHGGPLLDAPGAGDDGSGTVTILEAFRALLVGNYLPGGLRGSQALASRYETAGREVKGMVQFDMTAWHKAGTREEIAIITNDVDPALTEFLILLVDRYLDIPWVKDHYPPGPRSDHVSWTKAGYQSAHPLEARFENTNHHIHGVEDRIDISPEFSFDHILQ